MEQVEAHYRAALAKIMARKKRHLTYGRCFIQVCRETAQDVWALWKWKQHEMRKHKH